MEKQKLISKLRACASAGSCLNCIYHEEGCFGIKMLLADAADELSQSEQITDDERIRLNYEIQSLKNKIRIASKMIHKFMEDWEA